MKSKLFIFTDEKCNLVKSAIEACMQSRYLLCHAALHLLRRWESKRCCWPDVFKRYKSYSNMARGKEYLPAGMQ